MTKLNLIHDDPKYQNVWIINQLHDGPYTGPNYADELTEAERAIANATSAKEK